VRYRAIPQQPEAATAVVAEEIIVPERIIPIPEERAPQKLDSVKSAETRVKVANPVNRRVAIPKPSAKPMQNSIDESFKNALLGALALSKKDVPAVDGGVPAPSGGRELKVNHTGGVDSPVAKLDIRTAALSIDTSKNSKEFSQGGIEHQKIAMMQGRGFEVVSVPVPDGMSVEEGLSKDEVGSVIHSHRTEVRYCYESALIHNPEISGKVVVRFVIESSGRIQSVSPEQSSLNGSEVEKCVVSHIKSWKFPKPRDGGDISVSYPFHFRLMARE
jgi:TonB family protein